MICYKQKKGYFNALSLLVIANTVLSLIFPFGARAQELPIQVNPIDPPVVDPVQPVDPVIQAVPLEKLVEVPTVLIGDATTTDISQVDWEQLVNIGGKQVKLSSPEALAAINDLPADIKDFLGKYQSDVTAIEGDVLISTTTAATKKLHLKRLIHLLIADSLIKSGVLPANYLKLEDNKQIFPANEIVDLNKTPPLQLDPKNGHAINTDPGEITFDSPDQKIDPQVGQGLGVDGWGVVNNGLAKGGGLQPQMALPQFGMMSFASSYSLPPSQTSSSSQKAIDWLISKQNLNGSWGTTSTASLLTSAVIDAFNAVPVTGSTTDNGIGWLDYSITDNNDFFAQKTKLQAHWGEPTTTADILAGYLDTDTGGFGFKTGYQVDPATTADALMALTESNYKGAGSNPSLTISYALYFLTQSQNFDSGWSVVPGGVSSIPVTAKVLEALLPYKGYIVSGFSPPNINVTNYINNATAVLQSSQLANGTWGNNLVDTANAYYILKKAGVTPTYESAAISYFIGAQAVDGSFASSSIYVTSQVLKALLAPTLTAGDLVVTDIVPLTALQTGATSTIRIDIKNNGSVAVDHGVLHVIVDGFNYYNYDFLSHGLVINPGQTNSATIVQGGGNTRQFLGNVAFNASVEGQNGTVFPNSRYTENLTYATDTLSMPGLPVYYIAQKYVDAGIAGFNIRWQVKPDQNRLQYLAMYRDWGTSNWNLIGVTNTWNGIFVTGPFTEDGRYEVTAGVMANDGVTYYYFASTTEVRTSTSTTKYATSTASGIVSATGGVPMSNIYLQSNGGTTTTDQNGNYLMSNVLYGSTAIWPVDFRYEQFITKFLNVGANNTNVNLYTERRPDTQYPTISDLSIMGESDHIVPNKSPNTVLQFTVHDDIDPAGDVASALLEYYSPSDTLWHAIGTAVGPIHDTNYLKWNIPGNLVGVGYKIRATATDYSGKQSSSTEWVTFQITPGNAPPQITYVAPTATSTADASFVLKWIASDEEDPTTSIQFEYDTDRSQLNGTVATITTTVVRGFQDEYDWNTASVPTGTYYISAYLVDGHNGIAPIYSDFGIVVNHSGPSAPTSLLTDKVVNPASLNDTIPDFSAIYNDPSGEDYANYYQIQVSTSSVFATTKWDSSKTALTSSTAVGSRIADVPYGGATLATNTLYYWRIKFWDIAGNAGSWSIDTSTFKITATGNPYEPSDLQSQGIIRTENLVSDSSFEGSYQSYWFDYSNNGTSGIDCTVSYSGSCSQKVFVSSTGNTWDAEVGQDFRVNLNANYTVRFKMKASTSTNFVVAVGQDHSPYNDLGLDKQVSVNTNWQSYSLSFTSYGTDDHAGVFFYLGSHVGTYWLDDVEVIPDGLNKFRNPSFENDSYLDFWDFYANNGPSEAINNADCTNSTEGNCSSKTSVLTSGPYTDSVILGQHFAMDTSTTYDVTFDAKASTSTDGAVVAALNQDPYTLFNWIGFTMTPIWKSYSFEFTPPGGGTNSRLFLAMGDVTNTIWVDNMRFWPKPNATVTSTPLFSALYESPNASSTASSYQIQLITSVGDFNSPLWDSGQQVLATSTGVGARTPAIAYSGPALALDGAKYYWRMRFVDNSGNIGSWSNGKDYFQMAIPSNPTTPRVMQTLGITKSDNLIFDSSFEGQYLKYWKVVADNGVASQDCSVSFTGLCSQKLVVSSPGDPWSTTLWQDLRVDQFGTYFVKFRAKSLATSTITVGVNQDHDPFDDYGLFKNVTTTPNWKLYTYSFTSSNMDELAKVFFYAGTQTGTYWIEDVQVIPDGIGKIKNPGFENDLATDYWDFYSAGGPSEAILATDCTTSTTEGNCSQKISVKYKGSAADTVALIQGLSLITSTPYTVTFDAKASTTANEAISLQLNQAPWTTYSWTDIVVTTTWQSYSLDVTPSGGNSNSRLLLDMGSVTNTVWIDNVHFWPKSLETITTTPQFSALYESLDSNSSAAGYEVQVIPSGGDFTFPYWDSGHRTFGGNTLVGVRTPSISYTGPSLAGGSKYYWRIKFWDNFGREGDWTNGADYFNTANVTPNAATNLLTLGFENPSNLLVNPKFSAIYSDPNAGDWTSLYRLQVATSSAFSFLKWNSPTSTVATTTAGIRTPDVPYLGSALVSSTLYYWRIAFVDFNGLLGPWSTVTSTFTVGVNIAPTTPTSTLTQGLTNPSNLTGLPKFSAIYFDSNYGDQVKKYRIQVSTSSAFSFIKWDSATTTMATTSFNTRIPDITYAGTTLVSSTIYYWRIALVDVGGLASGWSTVTSTFTLAPTNNPPTAPTGTLVLGQTNPQGLTSTPQFSAIYNDPNTGDQANMYRVQVSTSSLFNNLAWDSGTTTMATTTVGSRSPSILYTGSALASSTAYYWRVAFADTGGQQGSWSTVTSTFRLAPVPTFVQSQKAHGAKSVLFGAPLTAGDLIIVGVTAYNTSIPSSTISDSKGNSYTKIAEAINGLYHAAIFYAKNIIGGSNVTVSSTVTSTIAVHEYSGVSTSTPLDKFAFTTGSSTLPNSGNITTTSSFELYFGLSWSGGASSSAWTAGSGYTLRQTELDNSTYQRMATEDQVISIASTTPANFVTSVSNPWAAVIATFKAAQ